jgi:long-chain acyl-CoA synthetase
MALYDLLARAAETRPQHVALEGRGATWSWATLDAHAARLGARLRAEGLGVGDRVALLTGSDPEAIAAFWALVRIGAVPVDIPAHAGTPTLAAALGDARPRAVLVDATSAPRLAELDAAALPIEIPVLTVAPSIPMPGAGSPRRHVELHAAFAAPPTDAARHRPGDTDPALVLYTSGTTGQPKGVVLSHRNLTSNVRAALELMQLGDDERLLLVVPLYFVHGRMQLLTFTALGATICLTSGFQFPQRVLDDLVGTRATMISGVPFHFLTLLARSRLHERALPDLRHVLVTGGALPHGALQRLSRALPGVRLHTAYGLTEAAPRVTYLGPDEVLTRRGSAGRPLPGVEVVIVGSDGRPLPHGSLGEVVVSGPGVMLDYVSGDARSSGRLDAGGRLHTGDLGLLDGDGYLRLFGRRSDLIKTAGERVFPGELEEILKKHGGVEDVAVLGLPDPALGERIAALVVPRPSLDAARRGALAAELKTFALRSVPFVRSPRELHLVDALPKTGSGKLDRKALPALAARAADAARARAAAPSTPAGLGAPAAPGSSSAP